jgi:hypothetical protein
MRKAEGRAAMAEETTIPVSRLIYMIFIQPGDGPVILMMAKVFILILIIYPAQLLLMSCAI